MSNDTVVLAGAPCLPYSLGALGGHASGSTADLHGALPGLRHGSGRRSAPALNPLLLHDTNPTRASRRFHAVSRKVLARASHAVHGTHPVTRWGGMPFLSTSRNPRGPGILSTDLGECRAVHSDRSRCGHSCTGRHIYRLLPSWLGPPLGQLLGGRRLVDLRARLENSTRQSKPPGARTGWQRAIVHTMRHLHSGGSLWGLPGRASGSPRA